MGELDHAGAVKILVDHPLPFLLAHGGLQTQIEETISALAELKISVEPIRWWDSAQTGDVIHFFGRPSGHYLERARGKNIRVVISDLLTELGSRSAAVRHAQRISIRGIQKTMPRFIWARMNWDAFVEADRVIALTSWEGELMRRIFATPAERIRIIPNGVTAEFFQTEGAMDSREDYLICTATITERKRVLELAQAAVEAKTPLWVLGRPYSTADSYAQRFLEFAQEHGDIIRYEGAVEDRQSLAQIYRRARGFVLLSSMESLSLSALEAAACKCPLLLSDLPWARGTFHDSVMYCPIASISETAERLRVFYAQAPQLPRPPKPATWPEVAQQLKAVYEELLNTSR